MSLSKKKEQELYETVHEEIMQARIKIWKMKDDPRPNIAEIDDILSGLIKTCPLKAVNCLKPKP